MHVLYTCKGKCGLTRARVHVDERGPEEDIAKWMELVKQAVADDHRRRAPRCASRECDLMIPLPKDGDRVGASVADKAEEK